MTCTPRKKELIMRYTASLAPTEMIDAPWITGVGFNDKPVLGELVFMNGQQYRIIAIRKNF